MANSFVQAMIDTEADADSLEVVVNGDENTDVTTRMGEIYPTVKKAIKLMTQAGVGFTSFETKAEMIASPLANGDYAIVTNDTATNNGLHLKKSGAWSKVAYDVDSRQKEYADAARDSAVSTAETYTNNELSALDTININSGKTYPLTYLKRSETATDSQNQYFVDALLDAHVINAERDYYYKLSYLQNGEVITGVSKNYGIIVERINIETGDTIRLIDYADPEKQVKPDRAKGGVQNFVLQTYLNTYIKLTFDVDKLPPDGTAIIARVETNFGYNSIIDPATYIYEPTEIYQQISDVDEDATTKANNAKTQAVAIATDLAALDATTKSNSARNEAINAAATDATEKADDAIETAYNNDDSIKSFATNIGRYELADYYSDLGESNQKLSLYSYFDDGASAPTDSVIVLDGNQIYVELSTSEKSLTMVWRHTPNRLMKTVWQPNGFNSLFNFKSISYSDNADLLNINWVSIQDITTDYIPPITFKATTQPLTETGVSTAGGNHSADGAKTADMTACQFYIGGKLLTADFSGVVDNVQARWTNKIFAPNTVVEQRYTLQQDVLAEFSHAHVAVTVKTTALEPVNITYEGGTQMYAKGWLDATSFYGGVNKGFMPNVTEYVESGTKLAAPNAWAVVVKSNDLGYFASYLDRNYGVKTDLIPSDGVMAARNNGTLPKYYNFTIRNQTLSTGDTYLWRGGYAYAPLSITNIESAFLAKLGGKYAVGYEALSGQRGDIKLPDWLIGKDFDQLNSTPIGIYVTAEQYQTSLSKEV